MSGEENEVYCQFQIGDHLEEDTEHAVDALGLSSSQKQKSGSKESFSEVGGQPATAALKSEADRPKFLFLTGRTKSLIRQDHLQEATCGSLQEHQLMSNKIIRHNNNNNYVIPRIRCSNPISAPPTPSGSSSLFHCSNSWASAEGEELYIGQYSRHLSNSITSIDEAQEFNNSLSPDDAISVSSVEYSNASFARRKSSHNKSFSRLSLNLGGKSDASDGVQSPSLSSSVKSPSLIPRFLRNSFSRLRGKNKSENTSAVSDQQQQQEQPKQQKDISPKSALDAFHKSYSSALLSQASIEVDEAVDATDEAIVRKFSKLTRELSNSSPEVSGILSSSPSTNEFYEETKGLPVIPFAFPTSVIAEKMKNKNRAKLNMANTTPTKSSPTATENRPEKSKPKAIKAPPKRRDSVMDYEVKSGEFGPASLDNLVHIAEVELARESLYGVSESSVAHSLAASSCGSGSIKWPYDDDEEVYNYNGRSRASSRSSQNSMNRKLIKCETHGTEDDGYIEMIPHSQLQSGQIICSSNNNNNKNLNINNNNNNIRALSQSKKCEPVKCLLSGIDADEHFPMDLSSKG